jgi:hypothetical protein
LLKLDLEFGKPGIFQVLIEEIRVVGFRPLIDISNKII